MYKQMAKSCVERLTEKEASANPPSLLLELYTNKCNYFRQKYVQS